MVNPIEGGLESEPNLEELKEQFREELLASADIPREFGGRAVFNDLDSFEQLEGHPEIINRVLREEFGFSPSKKNLVSEYSIEGTTDEEEGINVGEIKVRVFKTKDPAVFVGEYQYQDGSKVYALRPKELDDEEI